MKQQIKKIFIRWYIHKIQSIWKRQASYAFSYNKKQIKIFEKNIRNIKKNSIILMDIPNFGESSINNKTNYDQKFFTKSTIELTSKKIIL